MKGIVTHFFGYDELLKNPLCREQILKCARIKFGVENKFSKHEFREIPVNKWLVNVKKVFHKGSPKEKL